MKNFIHHFNKYLPLKEYLKIFIKYCYILIITGYDIVNIDIT